MLTRELNRATLARQLLLAREPVDPVEAVRRVVALQAQQAASPYLALWNRVQGLDPGQVDAAIADLRLVKATLMRITLHLVDARDHPMMHAAVQPTLRAARYHDDRFTRSGLSSEDADAVIPDLLELTARARTSAEVEQWLQDRLAAPPPGPWWALRQVAPLLHAPTGGPWSFGQRPSYLASRDGLLPYSPERSDQALVVLARRYLAAFGPASPADLAQFALVPRARARAAFAALDDVERLDGPDGGELVDVPGAPRPAADTAAPPRLMAMWDSVLLAHADRSRVLPAECRRLVTRSNGDVLPTLLVDGFVAGVWRPVPGGVEATAFRALSDEDWEGLGQEAQALTAFLADREPLVYRRYDRWWADLPAAQVRVLPG